MGCSFGVCPRPHTASLVTRADPWRGISRPPVRCRLEPNMTLANKTCPPREWRKSVTLSGPFDDTLPTGEPARAGRQRSGGSSMPHRDPRSDSPPSFGYRACQATVCSQEREPLVRRRKSLWRFVGAPVPVPPNAVMPVHNQSTPPPRPRCRHEVGRKVPELRRIVSLSSAMGNLPPRHSSELVGQLFGLCVMRERMALGLLLLCWFESGWKTWSRLDRRG